MNERYSDSSRSELKKFLSLISGFRGIPSYKEASSFDNDHLYMPNGTKVPPNCFSIFMWKSIWWFVQTDEEGYICYSDSFSSLSATCEFAYGPFLMIHEAHIDDSYSVWNSAWREAASDDCEWNLFSSWDDSALLLGVALE